MRICSVVGNKDSGKTSLTVRIIKELKKRDFKVASIKHSHHNMVMDKEGTDTFKHKEAGSETVVGIGSSTFFNTDKQLSLDRILFLIKIISESEPDFVVIEGFKGYNYPKIA
ncbi:MAG: molybdopterin-guanine dinucleotide biosynthesis protein B, partial [Methanobacteriaceae archaeon]|nr:molybdopterin-guanine dinucleotide biosynthesis protein B [Methanobacteriaceae archaeon]